MIAKAGMSPRAPCGCSFDDTIPSRTAGMHSMAAYPCMCTSTLVYLCVQQCRPLFTLCVSSRTSHCDMHFQVLFLTEQAALLACSLLCSSFSTFDKRLPLSLSLCSVFNSCVRCMICGMTFCTATVKF